jgi:nitrite reductase (cytochrome c-552)
MAASADGSTRGAHWRRYRVVYLAVITTALATLAVTALLVNIFEHKQEGRNAFYRVVALDENIDDPAVWGKNFPLQYDGYKRTVDQVRTRYGGSEAVPRTPTAADPRSIWRSRGSGRTRA